MPPPWPTRSAHDTRFATLMLANNETGAIQPVAELAALAAERGLPVHTDAVQAVGRIPVDFHALGVSTLAASADKFHGPVGVGSCWSGAACGSARGSSAAASSRADGRGRSRSPWPSDSPRRWKNGRANPRPAPPRWTGLRDRLESGLIAALGPERVLRNGPTRDDRRLPQTLNVGFPGLDGDALLMQLDLAGDRGLARLGLRQRLDPPLADPDGHARPRRPPAVFGALQPRRHDDRGRDRRGRPADRRGRRPDRRGRG